MHGRFILFGFKGEPFKADPMAHPAQVSSLAARLSEMQSESGESAAQSAAEAAAEVRGLHWIFTPRPLGRVHPLKIYQHIHFAVSEFILYKMSVWVTRRYTKTCLLHVSPRSYILGA